MFHWAIELFTYHISFLTDLFISRTKMTLFCVSGFGILKLIFKLDVLFLNPFFNSYNSFFFPINCGVKIII